MKPKREYGQPVPQNPRYDFEAFISRIKNLDFREMEIAVSSAIRMAERESNGAGSVAARESGSLSFLSRLKELSDFLNGNMPPKGLVFDRKHYIEIASLLVAKGQFKQEVLSVLKKPF